MLLTWAQTPLYAAVLSLFANGEPGWVFDNSRADTLFSDLAGTVPAVLDGPIGLQLDLSQGMVLGNELVTNGSNFTTTTGWANTTPANGTLSASGGLLTLTTTNNDFATFAITTVVGKWYKVSATIASAACPGFYGIRKADDTAVTTNVVTFINTATGSASGYFVATATTSYIVLQINGAGTASISLANCKSIAGNHRTTTATANRPTWSGLYNKLLNTATLSTQSVTVTAGSWTLYFTGSGSVVLSGAATGTKTAGSNVITCTAGTLTLTVTGSVLTADLRPTDQTVTLPAYQWVTTGSGAGTYDVNGFPLEIRPNGAGQFLDIPSLALGTATMMVAAGLRKTSDAALGIYTESSATIASNNGTFMLSAPNSAAGNFNFSAKGTTQVDNTVVTYAAPVTKVVMGLADIAAPSNTIQINGVQAGQVTTTLGTGTFGTFAQYFFGRAGASAFLKGSETASIGRGAAALPSAAQLAAVNAWLNQRARAY